MLEDRCSRSGRALLRAERAGEVVVGEGNVGAVLRVESYLEEIARARLSPLAQPVPLVQTVPA